ncbi:MAG: ferrous iron transport protein B [Candidatus Actinomarina sp.]
MVKTITVALIGNPNTGKSSVFNTLTGLKQKVGNYPGVTVEKKTGSFEIDRTTNVQLIDLPGTYGLNTQSLDQSIVFELLLNKNNKDFPDVVVVVADIENLKRNLLLFSQIKDLEIPSILVINMADQLKSKGIEIDLDKLEQEFDTKVVLLSARKNFGFDQLKSEIINYRNLSNKPAFDINEIDPEYFSNLQKTFPGESVYKLWLLITQDINYTKLERKRIHDRGKFKTKTESHLKKLQQRETIKRYQIINNLLKEAYVKDIKKATGLRASLDKILLHGFWGYLVFFSILLLIFQVIFDWSNIPMDFIDNTFVSISQSVKLNLPDGVFTSLLAEGVIPGLAGIIIFVPQIALLFFFISILEETGYMSRVVFLMDRTLRKFGLGGKSLIPLVSGVACAIPAVMATRNIENWKDRLITILVIPFMTCSARLPVYLILISLVIPNDKFFGINYQSLTLMGLYILGFLMAILSSYILKSIIKRDSKSYLVLEMPEYKLPLVKNIFLTVYTKTNSFIVEAGKIIFAISILLWIMASNGPGNNFKNADQIVKDKYESIEISDEELNINIESFKLEHSYIGLVGKSIEPIITPLGYDWKIGIALVTSFAAREVFVGTLSTIYSVGSEDQETIKNTMAKEKDSFGNKIFNLPTGLSLMIFYAFAMQCMSTLAIVKKETNSWKWPMAQLFFMTTLAYFASFFVYQILS